MRPQAEIEFGPDKPPVRRGPRFTAEKLEEITRRSWVKNMQMDALLHMAEAEKRGLQAHEHRCARSCCRPFPEWYREALTP